MNYFIIRPSKDICKNYGHISSLSKEGAVVLTVNGKEDTVLMNYEEYVKQQKYIKELESKLYIYTQLSQSIDDVKLGRVHDSDIVFEDLINDLKNIYIKVEK